MDKLTVILPTLPPTINHAYKSIGHGKKALTDEALAFKGMVLKEVLDIVNTTGWTLPAGSLEFHRYLTYCDKRNTDIDNRVKLAIDAVAAALKFNDARIDEIRIKRVGYDKGKPLCEMVLMAMRG
jgi:Holliday junction resolvase RusA-like endonuclease